METKLYHYKALVLSVYDGDTITVNIELGLNAMLKKQKIRLYGIDTPELRGGNAKTKAAAKAARDYLRGLIQGREIILRTYKDKTGKYGRWLGVVFRNGLNVNDNLIEVKHAVKAKY